MIYTIKAHETIYKGVQFRSRLEARWAAFFDLVGWEWKYEPIDLAGWTPDFWVAFSCGHSECTFIASTVPSCLDPQCYCKATPTEAAIEASYQAKMPFQTSAAYDEYLEFLANRHFNHWGKLHFNNSFRHELLVEVKPYFSIEEFNGSVVSRLVDSGWNPPHPAMFGIDPSVSSWQMAHGSGGGYERIENWADNIDGAWIEAGNIVQWKPGAPGSDDE